MNKAKAILLLAILVATSILAGYRVGSSSLDIQQCMFFVAGFDAGHTQTVKNVDQAYYNLVENPGKLDRIQLTDVYNYTTQQINDSYAYADKTKGCP